MGCLYQNYSAFPTIAYQWRLANKAYQRATAKNQPRIAEHSFKLVSTLRQVMESYVLEAMSRLMPDAWVETLSYDESAEIRDMLIADENMTIDSVVEWLVESRKKKEKEK